MTTGATEAIEELISQLGDQPGPLERVLAEWEGPEVSESVGSIHRGAPRALSSAVIEELHASWGPTGDPGWVDDLIPTPRDDEREQDFMFALYRRSGVFAYARLSGQPANNPARMKLVVGVVRMRH